MPGFVGGLQYFERKKTKGLMSVLSKLYEKPSASNKVFLMKRLFNMKMSEGGSVADHLNEFNTLTSQLSYVKCKWRTICTRRIYTYRWAEKQNSQRLQRMNNGRFLTKRH